MIEPAATPAYFALEFEDCVTAAHFAAALIEFLGTKEGEPYSAELRELEVWISSGSTRDDVGPHCRVYANERALRAARAAGLRVRRAEPVESGDLPRRRVLIIGAPPE